MPLTRVPSRPTTPAARPESSPKASPKARATLDVPSQGPPDLVIQAGHRSPTPQASAPPLSAPRAPPAATRVVRAGPALPVTEAIAYLSGSVAPDDPVLQAIVTRLMTDVPELSIAPASYGDTDYENRFRATIAEAFTMALSVPTGRQLLLHVLEQAKAAKMRVRLSSTPIVGLPEGATPYSNGMSFEALRVALQDPERLQELAPTLVTMLETPSELTLHYSPLVETLGVRVLTHSPSGDGVVDDPRAEARGARLTPSPPGLSILHELIHISHILAGIELTGEPTNDDALWLDLEEKSAIEDLGVFSVQPLQPGAPPLVDVDVARADLREALYEMVDETGVLDVPAHARDEAARYLINCALSPEELRFELPEWTKKHLMRAFPEGAPPDGPEALNFVEQAIVLVCHDPLPVLTEAGFIRPLKGRYAGADYAFRWEEPDAIADMLAATLPQLPQATGRMLAEALYTARQAPTENALREELGLPLRYGHAGTFDPVFVDR